ncbi:MAG: sensor histidine kinase [Candidatus Solibacter sp.]|nr:sensor histidine kinase [Candidatus Solibacter sp.]
MSNLARTALRNPKHLSDAIMRRQPLPQISHEIEVSPLRFWPVWRSMDTVLIGAQAVELQPADTQDLFGLQSRLTLHFLQLLGFERRLFARAQQRRGRGGRKVVRQIEMERQRLGRELHTGVGQMLAAIRLQLEVIATELPSPPANVAQALRSISTLSADTLEQVRDISRRVHPPEWQRLTLESAIRQLWEISGVPQRFEASFQIDPLPWEPHLEVKILFYRGLQEALSNLVRHSQATRVLVALELRAGQLVLSIHDNGVGFDVERMSFAPASVVSGIGLRSIRETAEELGGKLEVESGPNGTKLVISVAPFPVDS